MEIDFVKCESERPRSETCGAKSETRRSASFPSNHRPGMLQPKRQSAAKRAANNQFLATVSKHEGHAKRVFIPKLKGRTFLPPLLHLYGEASLKPLQALVTKASETYLPFYHLISHVGEVLGPFALINTGASSRFMGQPPCSVYVCVGKCCTAC